MSITPAPWEYVTDCHGNVSFESGVIWADREGNIVIDDDDARLIAAALELLELAYQYQSDLRHPPTADSRERRIERIAAVLAKVGAA